MLSGQSLENQPCGGEGEGGGSLMKSSLINTGLW